MKQKRNYNICIVDDDPDVLKTSERLYKGIIVRKLLEHLIGDSEVSISLAKNPKEAEAIISANLEKDPSLIQILHADERMPPYENGSMFIDRMRRKHVLNNFGALLITGYAEDASVQNSRDYGVYRFISKPITRKEITHYLEDVIEMILLKDKPIKQNTKGNYEFRLIKTPDEILELARLRYTIWNKLGYIPPDRQSPSTKLEIDEYDAFSIHLGGYEKRKKEPDKLTTTSRIITLDEQSEYKELFTNLVEKHGDDIIKKSFYRKRKYPFIIYEDFGKKIIDFLSSKNNPKIVEYSRFMNETLYRGLDLSIKTVQFLHMYSKFYLNMDFAFVACAAKHLDMNLTKNKFTSMIPHTKMISEQRVQTMCVGLYVDLLDFENPLKNEYSQQIHDMYSEFKKKNFVSYSKK